MIKIKRLSISRYTGVFAVCITTALILLGCSMQKESTPASQQPDLSIVYLFTAEATYDRIEINQNKLIYTYFDDVDNKAANWIRQEPVWTQNDLKTKETTLAENQLEDLIELIHQTNLMQLKNTYGGASSDQRYYPYSLSVSLGKEKKKVIYQSFPDAEPMPDAQKVIIDRLHELVKTNFL